MEANEKFNIFFLEELLVSYTGSVFADQMYDLGYNFANFRFYPEKELLC